MKKWAIILCIVLVSSFVIHGTIAYDIRIEGRNAVWVYQEAANEYHRIHPDITFTIHDESPSTALKEVYDRTIDIASIQDNSSKKGVDFSQLNKTVVAKDAIIVIVNSYNPIDSLDIEYVRGIFKDKIDNWGQIGGVFKPIITVGNNITHSKTGKQSGNRRLFYSKILNENVSSDDTSIQMNDGKDVGLYVAGMPYAIGYTNFFYIDTHYLGSTNTGYKSITLTEGMKNYNPTYENILNGSYPYYENFTICTRIDADPEVKQFVDFLLSPQGQLILAKNGHVPLNTIMFDDSKEVNGSIVISYPGQYWLTRDLTFDDILASPNFQNNPKWLNYFITINANNVVFDGMGRTLSCNAPSGEPTGFLCDGFAVSGSAFGPSSNVTIKNLTIISRETGIRVSEVNHVTLDNITFQQDGWPLYLNYIDHISLNNLKMSTFKKGGTDTDIIEKSHGCKCTNVSLNNKEVDKIPGDEPGCENYYLPRAFKLNPLVFLIIFLPNIIAKFIEGPFDYIEEKAGLKQPGIYVNFTNQMKKKTQGYLEKYGGLLKTYDIIPIISLIGAIILGCAFYYCFWYLDFDLYILAMFIVIAAIVVVVHELIHYLVSRKLGVAAHYKLWIWGIASMIITTILFQNVLGKPIHTEIEENCSDKKKYAFVMMSAPLAGLLLSLVFLLMWIQGGWNYYIGFIGFEMSLMTALISFFPVSPMDGEKVWSWNKPVWALIFFPIALAYFVLFIYPV